MRNAGLADLVLEPGRGMHRMTAQLFARRLQLRIVKPAGLLTRRAAGIPDPRLPISAECQLGRRDPRPAVLHPLAASSTPPASCPRSLAEEIRPAHRCSALAPADAGRRGRGLIPDDGLHLHRGGRGVMVMMSPRQRVGRTAAAVVAVNRDARAQHVPAGHPRAQSSVFEDGRIRSAQPGCDLAGISLPC